MSFEDAVPISRVTYGRNIDFDLGARGGTAQERNGKSRSGKQTVNISEDTLLRVARAKLGRMVDTRRGYTQQGAIAAEPSVGSLFSEKA